MGRFVVIFPLEAGLLGLMHSTESGQLREWPTAEAAARAAKAHPLAVLFPPVILDAAPIPTGTADPAAKARP